MQSISKCTPPETELISIPTHLLPIIRAVERNAAGEVRNAGAWILSVYRRHALFAGVTALQRSRARARDQSPLAVRKLNTP